VVFEVCTYLGSLKQDSNIQPKKLFIRLDADYSKTKWDGLFVFGDDAFALEIGLSGDRSSWRSGLRGTASRYKRRGRSHV
jgi:hypothetical protein